MFVYICITVRVLDSNGRDVFVCFDLSYLSNETDFGMVHTSFSKSRLPKFVGSY